MQSVARRIVDRHVLWLIDLKISTVEHVLAFEFQRASAEVNSGLLRVQLNDLICRKVGRRSGQLF
jgi:hypothetical protein